MKIFKHVIKRLLKKFSQLLDYPFLQEHNDLDVMDKFSITSLYPPLGTKAWREFSLHRLGDPTLVLKEHKTCGRIEFHLNSLVMISQNFSEALDLKERLVKPILTISVRSSLQTHAMSP